MSDALVIEAVRKSVTVDCTVEEAFRVFTTDATSWWPRQHSIHGDAVQEIVFEGREGGVVYERTTAAETAHWATVLTWEPPNRFVLEWDILKREGLATEVEVRFLPEGDVTRVELEHRGWEGVTDEPAERRQNYDTGWGRVLGAYAAGISSR
jgi:Activator of Hsp90 ATPase homolog 1-like protein